MTDRDALRRQAEGTIKGRAAFEAHVGRKSIKPLPPVELGAHTLLALLDDLDAAEARVTELLADQGALAGAHVRILQRGRAPRRACRSPGRRRAGACRGVGRGG